MRYVKVLFLILLFVVAMIFFVQNTQELSTPLSLKLDLFGYRCQSTPLPFYLFALIAFLVGGVFATLYFFVEKIRLGGELKQCKTRMARLEQELNSLRNLPMQEESYPTVGEDAETSES